MLGYDDSLDVFGVHGIGGIVGAIADRRVRRPGARRHRRLRLRRQQGRRLSTSAAQVDQSRLWGVGTVVVWSGVVAFVAYKIVDMIIGLRVPEDESAKVWTSPRTAKPPTASNALRGKKDSGPPCGRPFYWASRAFKHFDGVRITLLARSGRSVSIRIRPTRSSGGLKYRSVSFCACALARHAVQDGHVHQVRRQRRQLVAALRARAAGGRAAAPRCREPRRYSSAPRLARR